MCSIYYRIKMEDEPVMIPFAYYFESILLNRCTSASGVIGKS